jgi:hypothetical protein
MAVATVLTAIGLIISAAATATSTAANVSSQNEANAKNQGIADLNFSEQLRTERIANQEKTLQQAEQSRYNEIQLVLARKEQEAAEVARRANAITAQLANRNALRDRVSNLEFGGR